MTRLKLLGKLWRIRFVPTLADDLLGDCSDPGEPNKEIRLLSRLRGEELLEVLTHEILHAADWHKDEEWVEQVGISIARAAFKPEILPKIFDN